MADDPKPDPEKKPEPKKDDDPKPDPDAGAKAALDAERKARRDAEKSATDLRAKLKELEDKDKSDADKFRDENTQLKNDLNDANAKALRLEVAAEKGVKARWLTGTTREELERDADEYLEDHPPADGAKAPPPGRKPVADLKGGTDPTEDPGETDPAKLAEAVPRL